MDKEAPVKLLEGARTLGLSLDAAVAEALCRWADELLRWNQKINLTAVTQPDEVLEKHLLDSLALLPELPEGARVLDVGSGAGLPGIALALARPDLQVTMVEAVAKKVGFIKHGIALLGLAGRAEVRHLRLAGAPEKEGLGRFEVAVSRALAEPKAWVDLARPYLARGGRVLVLTAQPVAVDLGPGVVASRSFELPWSHAPRTVTTVTPP